jgi:molecular chaperone IbpA
VIENGLLHVDLVREVPEALKPRRIEIGRRNGDKAIEGKVTETA